MNCHAFQFARAVGLCAENPTDVRIKSALTNSNINPPSLYCLIKDHKSVVPGQPTPSRPVCSATESQTGPLGYPVMLILNGVADLINSTVDTESDSTEDMIAEMESVNQEIRENNVTDQIVLVFTDVKALYPSLEAEPSAEIVEELVVETGLQVQGFNWDEAAKYITVTA